MSFLAILVSFLLLELGKAAMLDENLIRGFLKEKMCSYGTILNCNCKQESLSLIKNLMSNGYRISTYDITNPDISAKNSLSKGDYNLAVIMDADCLNIQPFLEEAAALKYFHETFHWLILTTDLNISEKYRDIPLHINSDVTIARYLFNDENQSLPKWIIFDIYNPAYKYGGEAIIEKLGVFDSVKTNALKYTNEPRYFKRRNMSGIILQSMVVVPDIISITVDEYLANDKDRYNNSHTRFSFHTVNNCQHFFGFINNKSLTHSYGYEYPSGEVDGVLKEMKEKRTDFASSHVYYRSYRVKFVDYGVGSWIQRSTFIFQHPKTTSSSYELYLRPLVNSVWFTTMIITVLMIVILRIIMVKEAQVFDFDSAEDDSSWSFLLMYGIGELCQQGFTLIPTLVSGKIVTFIVLLFSFMLYQFYSASIVSLLLLAPARTIKTLDDLLTSNLEAGCENVIFNRDYFQRTTNPVAIKLHKLKIERKNGESNFVPLDVGMKKVASGGYAFHAQTSAAYPIIESTFPEKIICNLAEVDLYPTEYIYMMYQKHSPFKEMFNYCLLHQVQVGVMNRLQKNWNAAKPICLEPTNYLEISVGLTESYWALVLLGCGYMISLSLLVLEFLWKRSHKFRKQFTNLLSCSSAIQ